MSNLFQYPLDYKSPIVNPDGTPTDDFIRKWQQMVAQAVITVLDENVTFSDITTGNATTLVHGFLPKLSGDATTFLDGTGHWTTPAGGDLDMLFDAMAVDTGDPYIFLDFGG